MALLLSGSITKTVGWVFNTGPSCDSNWARPLGGCVFHSSGADGTVEKDIVLATAQRLQKVLVARGYTVHMTRDSDDFIELRQRVRIARSWRADLMISIHADFNHDPEVSGLSIDHHAVGQGLGRRSGGAGEKRKTILR